MANDAHGSGTISDASDEAAKDAPANSSIATEHDTNDGLAVVEQDAESESAGHLFAASPKVGYDFGVVSSATHKSMQGNKRKNTRPELVVRQRLRQAGLSGYRIDWAKAPGRPDIAYVGRKVAIEVRGCFWHRCPHCSPSVPKKNADYWQQKFARNVERDERNLAALHEAGWKVHIIWECQLKKGAIDDTFAELLPQLAEELGKELRGECGDV